MPQGEKFWNPYRMVPVRNSDPKQTDPTAHHRFAGMSGSITCSLTTLTHFLVGNSAQQEKTVHFLQRENKPVVPGTSLKGMIRSLAELAGNGCAVVGSSDRKHKKCTNNRNLCITCRMFGMLESGKVHMGKISFSDAEISAESTCQTISKHVVVGSPKPRHIAFYKNPATGRNDNTVRKHYFHQPAASFSQPDNQNKQCINIKPLEPAVEFSFTVFFNNLQDDELNLLLYCLTLENEVTFTHHGHEEQAVTLTGPLRHKLGFGKPHGLGSVKITPEQMCLMRDMRTRYSSNRDSSQQILKNGELQKEILERTASFCADSSDAMQHLRKMLLWRDKDAREFHYPDFHWFKVQNANGKWVLPNPANSTKPLKKV